MDFLKKIQIMLKNFLKKLIKLILLKYKRNLNLFILIICLFLLV